jgi:hypothetical protein
MTTREIAMVLIIGLLVMGKRSWKQHQKVARNKQMRAECAAARNQARIGR